MEIKAKKYFGQNFISDKNLVRKIVNTLDCNQNNGKNLVIEIGPGTGALTELLLQRFQKVVAIEIDHDLADMLLTKFSNNKDFELIAADILTIDFQKLFQKYQQKYPNIYLISNLPYYITSPVLFKTFPVLQNLKKVVFMMQREVAERVTASAGGKNYNNLSVISDFYAVRTYEFTVKKTNFRPVPKVDSAIVSFYPRHDNFQIINPEEFANFVRTLFNNRRKTLLNNLTNITQNKQLAEQFLKFSEILPSVRPEMVPLESYIKLYKNVVAEKNKL